ncbi:hypothetical protein PFISCL1PPCAC_27214 [Pristionchus fissidentatus]|uniref:Chromo domain-containing protein n=1 Tax=Pristionchus fissidentatus TaxID=1538716 RepID=A0AAV5WV33_9BILA|nr:hypothetical protein PFISCL1PPCAC_27214 [Pristionchus fissidentatus]
MVKQFRVREILDERMNENVDSNLIKEYLVKWEDDEEVCWSRDEYDSWEPEGNLTCLFLIKNFKKQRREEERQRKKKDRKEIKQEEPEEETSGPSTTQISKEGYVIVPVRTDHGYLRGEKGHIRQVISRMTKGGIMKTYCEVYFPSLGGDSQWIRDSVVKKYDQQGLLNFFAAQTSRRFIDQREREQSEKNLID